MLRVPGNIPQHCLPLAAAASLAAAERLAAAAEPLAATNTITRAAASAFSASILSLASPLRRLHAGMQKSARGEGRRRS